MQYGLDGGCCAGYARAQGYRRALPDAARLPAGDGIGAEAARYMRSRNRYVRFYALMTQLAEPATSLRRMAEYDIPFRPAKCRRSWPCCAAVCCRSANRSSALRTATLRMVGLGIVRQFGIEEVERLLLAMVAAKVPELGRSALCLCSMRCSLRRRGGGPHRLDEPRRTQGADALHGAGGRMRLPSLRRLFDDRERPYYESLIHSYKRSLVC